MARKSIFTYIGILCILSSLLLTAYNYAIDFYYGRKANENSAKLAEIIENNVSDKTKEDLKYANLKSYELEDGSYVGILDLPTIERSLPVLSDTSSSSLNVGAGVYCGTPYVNNFVIAAHARKTFFGPLNDLKKGDKVYFQDIYGNTFRYEVDAKDILHQESIDEMIESGYDMTLFTCDNDRTYRITIRLNKIDETYINE